MSTFLRKRLAWVVAQKNRSAEAPYKYREGDKIIHIPSGKIYDFGHYSKIAGMCVVYDGEHTLNNSFTVRLTNIRRTFK